MNSYKIYYLSKKILTLMSDFLLSNCCSLTMKVKCCIQFVCVDFTDLAGWWHQIISFYVFSPISSQCAQWTITLLGHIYNQECESVLIVCGSGFGSIKFGEYGSGTRTITSQNLESILVTIPARENILLYCWIHIPVCNHARHFLA